MQKILVGTFIVEGTGALILGIRFSFDFGFVRGMYYGIFHAISAFCNGGFDLMGRLEPYSSLTYYAGDVVVNVVICSLIIIGGIGFVVWDDITTNGLHFKNTDSIPKSYLLPRLFYCFQERYCFI